jgi:hypothetical protein
MKLVSPDRGCVEADVGTKRYKGRIIEVSDATHAAALKEIGYFPASVGGVARSREHVCPNGHRNYFVTCGRCA